MEDGASLAVHAPPQLLQYTYVASRLKELVAELSSGSSGGGGGAVPLVQDVSAQHSTTAVVSTTPVRN
jgi:hypothetical protein